MGKHTQAEIDKAKSKLTCALGKAGNNRVLDFFYMRDNDCDMDLYKKYILLKVLSYWKQDKLGNTTQYTNYSTSEDISNILSWVGQNCN